MGIYLHIVPLPVPAPRLTQRLSVYVGRKVITEVVYGTGFTISLIPFTLLLLAVTVISATMARSGYLSCAAEVVTLMVTMSTLFCVILGILMIMSLYLNDVAMAVDV